MYKKQFAVQTRNLLSKKDLKGLRAQLSEEYPGLDSKAVDELLPEGKVQLLKLDTRGLLYAEEGLPAVFFDPDGRGELFPTLHTLWLHPNIMAELTIHAEVSKYVLNGADLMLPGVIVPANGVAGFGSVSKGQKRCIKIDGNPYPIAVGKMLVNQSQMEKLKGKGLEVCHVFKDLLWAFSGKPIPNSGFSEKEDEVARCSDAAYVPGAAPASTDDASPAAAAEKDAGAAAAGYPSPAGAAAAGDVSPAAACAEGDATPASAAAKETGGAGRAAEDWSQDELLDFCFMQAFKVSLTDDKNLPVEASDLYEKHMKPSRPDGTTLDVKKSSHKQIGKYLNALRKAKVIEVNEKKGVISVTKVAREHKHFAQLQEKFAGDAAAAETAAGNASVVEAPKDLPPPVVTTDWKIKSDYKGLMELFEIMGKSKNDMHSAEVSRNVLLEYIKKEDLGSGEDSPVKLNEVLISALYRTAGGQKKDLTFPDEASFDELEEKMLSRMAEHTTIDVAGLGPTTRKGSRENWLIEVSLSRKGAHNVTRVCNLEAYGLDVQSTGDELKRKLNCTVHIEPMPGKNSKDNSMTLQGHVDKELADFLQQRYGITKAFMSVK